MAHWTNLISKEYEYFIRKNPNNNIVNWYGVSRNKLSEQFIREFSDKVDWFNISYHQNLSKKFIYEFYDKVHWDVICSLKDYDFSDAPKHVKLYIALNYRALSKYFK